MDNRFMTETAAMRTLTFSPPRGDTSFKIGVTMVAVLAAAEVFFAGYHYAGRFRHRTASTAPTSTQPATVAPAATAPPVAVVPAPTVAPEPTAAIATESTPAPAVAASDDALVREGVDLTNRGDSASALNRFQQATEKNPRNAQAYAEMAKIYETTNNLDRSNEMWRKVAEIGPSAGVLYELADARLKRGVTATPAPAVTEATPAQAPPTPSAPSEGIPDGSTFGISEVTANETPDPDSDTNLLLKIGVKKRANAVIDHTRVKIQVFFYDTVDDRDIKLTDAEVNYEWLTPDHDWASAKPEVLAVTYVRPKNKARSQENALSEAAASINPNKRGRAPVKPAAPASDDSGHRKYLGYIVRIYYNDKLQAVRADPTKLLNLFPPPSTTSP
jgi:tetratricopeptide (TPR) repeat protein